MCEAVEVCPHCDSENVYPEWDTDTQGFIAICKHCGKKIFLCDECMHKEDNPEMNCDWRQEGNHSICMRGKIEEEI